MILDPTMLARRTRRARLVAALAVLAAAATPLAAHAVTFADSLTHGTLDPNLFSVVSTGYSLSMTSAGAVLSRPAGLPNGGSLILSGFTFSGAFDLSVDVTGLTTGLGDQGEAGLAVFRTVPSAFSDIFGYNNTRFFANNSLGVTLLDTPTGPDSDHLDISGNSGVTPFAIQVFLLMEYSGTHANSATFSNLKLNADRIDGLKAAGIPEPATWALMVIGSGLAGAGLRRSRRQATSSAL